MRDDEETYNYAPFKQSNMFAKGVTCSDCHDPHSARLRAPVSDVCAQCHAPTKYAMAAHQHHAELTPSLTCASCHMPGRTYMVIDRRHDHGFRIPRPDLSVQFGTPNACNDCHRDKTAGWAAAKVDDWFGPHRRGYQSYANAFHVAWTDQPDAADLLASLAALPDTPAIARASALAELPAPDLEAARRGLADPDPLVRIGALDMLEAVPSDQLWPLVSPGLSDPVRGVRIRAAELLGSVPLARRPAADNEKFERAASEFVAAQKLNADRPDAHTELGDFYIRQGKTAEAESEYRAAIRLDPSFSAAAINLSDLYRQFGRDRDGERVLRDALSTWGKDASLHHALGLTLAREKRLDPALEELRLAALLDPGQPHYGYVYAVGLHSAGRPDEALAALKASLQRHPNDRELLAAALAFSRERGDMPAALDYAERLARLSAQDDSLSKLIDELRQKVAR